MPARSSVNVRIGSRLGRGAIWARTTAALLLGAAVVAGGCAQRSLPAVLNSGDANFKGGRFDAAAADYQEYVDRKPGDHTVRVKLGETLLKLDEPTRAAEQLRVAYSQRPGEAAYLDALCDALIAAGQTDELYRLLRTNAADRGTVDDHIRLGRYAMKLGDADTARVALLAAARVDRGTTPAPYVALTDFYLSINDTANATRRLRMAYFIDPEAGIVMERLRRMNVIVGPTFGLVPDERSAAPQ